MFINYAPCMVENVCLFMCLRNHNRWCICKMSVQDSNVTYQFEMTFIFRWGLHSGEHAHCPLWYFISVESFASYLSPYSGRFMQGKVNFAFENVSVFGFNSDVLSNIRLDNLSWQGRHDFAPWPKFQDLIQILWNLLVF